MFHIVTPSLVIISFIKCISYADGASFSCAPEESAPKISKTERSKLKEEIPIILSSLFIENLMFISVIVLQTASWVITTPFGVPVLPDVYIT